WLKAAVRAGHTTQRKECRVLTELLSLLTLQGFCRGRAQNTPRKHTPMHFDGLFPACAPGARLTGWVGD
ncbi:hypothetical protein KUCAC02_023928, partial [Chaenocephalus aceratus]